MQWLVDLARAAPFTTLIIVCATYYTLKWIICLPPRVIRARAEARCQPHDWELLREGPLVKNIGEADEKLVVHYHLYRCKKCGAKRNYK